MHKMIIQNNYLYSYYSDSGYIFDVYRKNETAFLKARGKDSLYDYITPLGVHLKKNEVLRFNISNNKVYLLEQINNKNNLSLVHVEIEYIDSIKYKERQRLFRENLLKQYPDINERRNYLNQQYENIKINRNRQNLIPYAKLIEMYYVLFRKKVEKKEIADVISFDFLVRDTSQIVFFLMDNSRFSLWEFEYNKKNRNSSFILIKSYTIDSVFKMNNILKNEIILSPQYDDFIKNNSQYLHNKNKTVLNSILDTNFFEGKIDIIEQNNNFFLINAYRGDVYQMYNDSIVKIASLSLEKEHRTNFNLYIEDRDLQKIIFFQKLNVIKEGECKLDYIDNSQMYNYEEYLRSYDIIQK